MRISPRTLLALSGTVLAATTATAVLVLAPVVGADDAGAPVPATVAPPTTSPAPPATVAPPTTVAPPAPTTTVPAAGVPDDGSLGPGDHGPAVLALQQRLVELGFWLGEPDAGYGRLTEQAVLAFQKAAGLERDGAAGPATRTALATAERPTPRSAEDGVEVDMERQLLLVVRGGRVEWAINTSTGASSTPTPLGDFVVQREIDGIRVAPLGRLYRPKYFDGGIAVHGSPSIPGYPASHGCARVSNPAMDHLWASGALEVGTPVRVH